MQTAKNRAEEADYYLNSGSAINWVCDKMSSALFWAMEAWLLSQGYSPDFRNGWGSIRIQFRKYAPKDIGVKKR